MGKAALATRLMEKCYKEVKAAKAKSKTKPSLPLDAGSGGGAAPALSGVSLKKGSLDEVAAQVAAAAKTGG